jgi:hypothetical protein
MQVDAPFSTVVRAMLSASYLDVWVLYDDWQKNGAGID